MYSSRDPWPTSSTYENIKGVVSYVGSPNLSRGDDVERGRDRSRERRGGKHTRNDIQIPFKTSSPVRSPSCSMLSMMIGERREDRKERQKDNEGEREGQGNGNGNGGRGIGIGKGRDDDGNNNNYNFINQMDYISSLSSNRRRSASAPPRSSGGNNIRNNNTNLSESTTNLRQNNDSISNDINLRWTTRSLADFISNRSSTHATAGPSLSASVDLNKQNQNQNQFPNQVQGSSNEIKRMTSSLDNDNSNNFHSPIGHRSFSLRRVAKGQGQWQGHGHGQTTSSVLFGEAPRAESIRDVRNITINAPYAVSFPDQ